MTETDPKPQPKAIPELSIESQLLVDQLVTVAAGDVIPYATLAAAIGQPVQSGTGRNRLQTARRILQRDHATVFEAVANVGLKRMDAAGCVRVGSAYRQRIRRASKRGLEKLLCADPADLTNAQKTDFHATASHLGVLHHLTGRAATKQLAAAVEKTDQRLPVAKTLAAFTET